MTESTIITYRSRKIDLSPYLEGFPYVGFEFLPKANLLLYFHDLPDRRPLKVQPLDQPFDPNIGRTLTDADWNLRSFWEPAFDRVHNAILMRGVSASIEEKWAMWWLRVGNTPIWEKVATMTNDPPT